MRAAFCGPAGIKSVAKWSRGQTNIVVSATRDWWARLPLRDRPRRTGTDQALVRRRRAVAKMTWQWTSSGMRAPAGLLRGRPGRSGRTSGPVTPRPDARTILPGLAPQGIGRTVRRMIRECLWRALRTAGRAVPDAGVSEGLRLKSRTGVCSVGDAADLHDDGFFARLHRAFHDQVASADSVGRRCVPVGPSPGARVGRTRVRKSRTDGFLCGVRHIPAGEGIHPLR